MCFNLAELIDLGNRFLVHLVNFFLHQTQITLLVGTEESR